MLLFAVIGNNLFGQISIQGDAITQGIEGVSVVSEHPMEGIIIELVISNADSTIIITERASPYLEEGFNKISPHSIVSDTSCAQGVDVLPTLSRFGLPSGEYNLHFSATDSTGRVYFDKEENREWKSRLLSVSDLGNDTVLIKCLKADTALVMVENRFRRDSLRVGSADLTLANKYHRSTKYSLVLGSEVWDTYKVPSTDKTPLGVKTPMNELGAAPKQESIISIQQLTFTSAGEYRERPIPGSLYEYPYFTHSLNGIVSVATIPLRVNGLLFIDKDFNAESLRSPINYFTVEYDEDLWKEQQIGHDALGNKASKLKSRQYDILKKRQRLIADIREMEAPAIPSDTNLIQPDFPGSPDSLGSLDLNTDSAIPENQLPTGKIARLKKRKDKMDKRLQDLKAEQERIAGLAKKLESKDKRVTMKELELDSARFKRFTPGIKNLKSVKIGNIFPTRFSYTPLFHFYPQLTGVSSEYRVAKSTTVYGLLGRTRNDPFGWADSLNVIEAGLSQNIGSHKASVMLSRMQHTGRPNETLGSSSGLLSYIIEPSVEFSLGQNTSLGATMSYFHDPANDSVQLSNTRNLIYLTTGFKGVEFESFAELTMANYENPLELSTVPDALRVGQRASWLVTPIKTSFIAGVTYNHQGVFGDNTNRNMNLEFGLQTMFKSVPNLTVRYTPFAGFSTFNYQGVAPITHSQSTSSLLGALSYMKTLKRHVLSTVITYHRLSNVVVFPTSTDYTLESMVETYTLSASLSNKKHRMTISGSALSSSNVNSTTAQAQYMRNLGKVVSLGAHAFAGQSKSQSTLSVGVPIELRLFKKFSITTEAGYYLLTNFPASPYGRVQGVLVF